MVGVLRWGFLGPGSISEVTLADFKLAGIRVDAVASRSLDRAENYAKKHNLAKAYGSYQELADDDEIDVIYIATTNSAHYENAMLCLEAGKHVLLEKPFTLNQNQAKEIAALAKSEGCFVMEAMWTRFLPNHTRLFEILDEGTIGEVLYLSADHNQLLPVEKVPRLHDSALGGGSLLDLGIYPISFAHRIFGRPTRILASAVMMPGQIDESMTAIFEYSGPKRAMWQSSIRSNGSVWASIQGTLGRIELEKSFYQVSPFSVFDSEDRLIERFDTKIEGRGMHLQALEVERCIEAGLSESPIMSLDETIEIMGVMDEIRALTGIKYSGE